ncbi:MAG: SusC/RagA family TonB-linked outer membrane protein, partial [Candidatus Cryptobacteroides sp.]
MKKRLLNCFLAGLMLACLPDFVQAEPTPPGAEILSDETILVNGVVVDNNGEPLIGVGINVGTHNIGTTTDLDGNFSIQVNVGDELHFYYVGFVTKKIVIENHEPLRVVMDEDFQNLEEVVVVGYGTTKKKDLTGSIESIRAGELSNAAAPNAMQLLQGKVAGLYINSGNQDPGASNIVLLRGVGSLSGSSEPLVVVDGLPVNDMAILNTIASENIEQIDVLKDASATAIYGSRGANGVIIITTTSGKAERLSVSYGAKFSLETIGRTVDMMNSEEYIRFYYDLAHDKDFSYGFEPGYNGENYPYPLEAIGTLADTDWQKEVTRNPLSHEHNLTLSGGNESLKYRISGNFYDGKSIVGPYDYKRYNFDSKVTYNKNKFSFIAG